MKQLSFVPEKTPSNLPETAPSSKNGSKRRVIDYIIIGSIFFLIGSVSCITTIRKDRFESSHYGLLFLTDVANNTNYEIGEKSTLHFNIDNILGDNILKNNALIISAYAWDSNTSTADYSVIHYQFDSNLTHLEKITTITPDYTGKIYPIGYNTTCYFFMSKNQNKYYLQAFNATGFYLNKPISIPGIFDAIFPESYTLRICYLDFSNNTYNMILQAESINAHPPTHEYKYLSSLYLRYEPTNLTIISSQPIISALGYHLDSSSTLWAFCHNDPIVGALTFGWYRRVECSYYGYTVSNGELGALKKTIHTVPSYSYPNEWAYNYYYRELHTFGEFVENNQIVIPYFNRESNGENFTYLVKYGTHLNDSLHELLIFNSIQFIKGSSIILIATFQNPRIQQKLKLVFDKFKQKIQSLHNDKKD